MKSQTQWAFITTSVKPSLWNNCLTIIETPCLMYAIAKFYHIEISLWYAICIDEFYRYYLNGKNVDTYANSLCLFLFLLSMSGMDRDLARGLLFKSNILCRFWFCGPFFVTPVSATKSESNEGYELTWYSVSDFKVIINLRKARLTDKWHCCLTLLTTIGIVVNSIGNKQWNSLKT